MKFDNKAFLQETLARAKRGDAEAGKEALKTAVTALDTKDFNSPVIQYLARCLWDYVGNDIPLERALNVEDEPNKGGRKLKYDPVELMAVDVLLRYHAGMTPEEAIAWIDNNIGADRRTVQRIRVQYAPMEEMDRDLLLHSTGSLRKNLEDVLPHT